MSNKNFASKNVRKAIMKAMTPAQRRDMKIGEIFSVRLIHTGSPLRRWGDDENMAKLAVGGNCCRIYRNSLVNLAWNWDPDKAAKEAAVALDYFINGGEYKVIIM